MKHEKPPLMRGPMSANLKGSVQSAKGQNNEGSPESEITKQISRASGSTRQYAVRKMEQGGRLMMRKAGGLLMKTEVVSKPVSRMQQMLRTTTAGRAIKATGKGISIVGKGVGKGLGAGTETISAVQEAASGQHGDQAGTVIVEASARSAVKTGINITSYPARRLMKGINRKLQSLGIKVVKAIGKVMMQALKLLLSVAKSVIGLIVTAAGPVVAILLMGGILVILFGSAFGIIWNDENSKIKISDAVADVDKLLPERINRLSASIPHDVLTINYISSDGRRVNNWPDMLAVYAVSTTEHDPDTMDVLQFDDKRLDRLRNIFNEMTVLDFSTHTETHYDEEGNSYHIEVLTINVNAKDRKYAYNALSFGQSEISMCEELANYSEFQKAIGKIDTYGVTARGEVSVMGFDLPESAFSSKLCIQIATRLGDPYSQSGGLRKSDDAADCSGLIWHTFRAMGFTDFPSTASRQAEWCYERDLVVSENSLMPGDLVFWSKNYGCSCGDECTRFMSVHHVGMYVGDGKIIDASSGAGRVVYRDLWKGGSQWSLAFYARIPDAYFNSNI